MDQFHHRKGLPLFILKGSYHYLIDIRISKITDLNKEGRKWQYLNCFSYKYWPSDGSSEDEIFLQLQVLPRSLLWRADSSHRLKKVDAERDLLQAQADEVATVLQEYTALINLVKAIGGRL